MNYLKFPKKIQLANIHKLDYQKTWPFLKSFTFSEIAYIKLILLGVCFFQGGKSDMVDNTTSLVYFYVCFNAYFRLS